MQFPLCLRRLLLCCCLPLFLACGEASKPTTPGSATPGPDTQTPAAQSATAPPFSADSAYAYIAQQVAFGPRVPGTPQHAACADWLAGKLKAFGAQTQVQNAMVKHYSGRDLNIKNIIGSFNPGAQRRVLLSAHWDSRPVAEMDPNRPDDPIEAANDGASGVGVLLEIARQLGQMEQLDIGVDIIFWDAEDWGNPDAPGEDTWGLGSQHWSRNPHQGGYMAEFGINLDMVGAADATFLQEGYSLQYASHVVNRVWQTAHTLGHGQYFPFLQGPTVTDDHYYVNRIRKVPMIDIIDLRPGNETETIFFQHWHTHEDNLEKIHKPTLQAVGETVLFVTINPAAGS